MWQGHHSKQNENGGEKKAGGGPPKPGNVLVTDPGKLFFLGNELKRLWGITPDQKFKGLFAKPVSLERKHFPILQKKRYMVAEKSDGVAFVMMMSRWPLHIDPSGSPFCVLVDSNERNPKWYEISVYAGPDFFKGTLLICELVWETVFSSSYSSCTSLFSRQQQQQQQQQNSSLDHHPHDGLKKTYNENKEKYLLAKSDNNNEKEKAAVLQTLLAYDVAYFKGQNVSEKNFFERHELLKTFLGDSSLEAQLMDTKEWQKRACALGESGKVVCAGNEYGLTIRYKRCLPVQNADTVWRAREKLGHESDGLILTPVHEPIQHGTQWTLFKYKTKEKCTIDFTFVGEKVDEKKGDEKEKGEKKWRWSLYFVSSNKKVCATEPFVLEFYDTDAIVDLCSDSVVLFGDEDEKKKVSEKGFPKKQQNHQQTTNVRFVMRLAVTKELLKTIKKLDARGVEKIEFVGECFVEIGDSVGGSPSQKNDNNYCDQNKSKRAFSEMTFSETSFQEDKDDMNESSRCRMLICRLDRLRTEKSQPNNKYTFERTLVNIHEDITPNELFRIFLR